ncbi:hypothetical protein FJTKL_14065 [Diaporthe vaccinii]|uniref:Uncharacterized protein n=1 Tax=Diaporthe vaccinii TaxID=105482 RepID=A0ABR4E967_9PEZI
MVTSGHDLGYSKQDLVNNLTSGHCIKVISPSLDPHRAFSRSMKMPQKQQKAWSPQKHNHRRTDLAGPGLCQPVMKNKKRRHTPCHRRSLEFIARLGIPLIA